MTALRSSLSGLLFLSLCCAQSTSISLTGSATLGPAPNSKYNFTGSGGGTLTPGGAVQFAIDVIGTGDDNCNDNIEAPLTITAANGDKLMLTVLVPHTSGTTFSASFAITGGTGQYAGKGGSGTVTFALTSPPPNIAVMVTLTGNLTSQVTPNPSINPSGVVPVGHSRSAIQPGSWISVYGKNLATSTTVWDGQSAGIPTTLGGLTATINGKAAYFWFTSPGQINLQAPDDSLRGCANVTINTPNGPVSTQVQLAEAAPSLNLLDVKYPAAVIPTPNGGGAYAGGKYDLAGPAGRFSYSTRPVKKGETVVLYGVGFGPTVPAVPAGKAFTGAAPVDTSFPVQVLLNNNPAPASFVGLVGAGLFQINLVVPQNAISGDNVLRVVTPGAGGSTQDGIYLTVQ